MTIEQEKFAKKIKEQLGYTVDFNTYFITRGRGWSKAGGSCGATIDATFEDNGKIFHTTLLLTESLRNYNAKSYYLDDYIDRLGDTWIYRERISTL